MAQTKNKFEGKLLGLTGSIIGAFFNDQKNP
jgi:hypothetical protein